LKEDFVVLNTKYGGLDERLLKTNAVLKNLDDWSVAYDFSRVTHGFVPFPGSMSTVAPLNSVHVSAYVPQSPIPSIGIDGKLPNLSDHVGMSILDLDNMIV